MTIHILRWIDSDQHNTHQFKAYNRLDDALRRARDLRNSGNADVSIQDDDEAVRTYTIANRKDLIELINSL